MGRARLMAQQRQRLEEWRKKKKAPKKPAKKKVLEAKPPKTEKPKPTPKPAEVKPAQPIQPSRPAKPSRPVQQSRPAKPSNSGNGSVKAIPRKTSYQKEVEKRNKIDKGWVDTTGKEDMERSMKNEIQLNKPKNPKLGSKYKDASTGQVYYYDGSKWVKGKLGKVTRFKKPK